MLYLLQAFAETGLKRWKGGWSKALIQLVNISTVSPTRLATHANDINAQL